MTSRQLQKNICGCLLSCIHAHGAISKNLIGSAAKRIGGQINVGNILPNPVEDCRPALFNYLVKWEENLIKLRRESRKPNKSRDQLLQIRARAKQISVMITELKAVLDYKYNLRISPGKVITEKPGG